MSNKIINATQCRMARAALGWSTRELAVRAMVSTATVVTLEGGGEALRPRTLKAIADTFEAANIRFVDTDTETGAVVLVDGPDAPDSE